MSKKLYRPWPLLIVLTALSAFALQDKIEGATANLDAKYKDRLVMLRSFSCGQKLVFDAEGNLVSGDRPKPGPTCQGMRIRQVTMKDGKLAIAAQRVHVSYDCAESGFREVADAAPINQETSGGQKISVEARLPIAVDEAAVTGLMDKLFYLSTGPQEIVHDAIARVGDGVSAPKAIYTPDPDYSEKARKSNFQGTVVLSVIVGPDGRVHNVRVTRSLGRGLNEKAMEKVMVWEFKPAMRCGQPVAVELSVEIAFHLVRNVTFMERPPQRNLRVDSGSGSSVEKSRFGTFPWSAFSTVLLPTDSAIEPKIA